MGQDGKKARFGRFHESVGKPEYAPDFLDSMIRVMADGDRCIEERVLAWAKYRAWGNSSKDAIHIYSRNDGKPPVETLLGQQECALELAWLEAGAPAEWLDAPMDLFQAEFGRRGLHAAHKSVISRGFHANEISGTIAANTGRKIEPVVSPPLVSFTPKVARPCNFELFLQWRKVARPCNFEELEVARRRVAELRQVERLEYVEWLKLQAGETPAVPPIIPIIPIIQEATASDLVVIPEEPEPLPETPPPPFPECPEEHKNGTAPVAVEPEPEPVKIEPFVAEVQAKFPQNPPTLHQCAEVLAKLRKQNLPLDGFIRYLNPERMSKIDHGGALKALVEGYAVTEANKAKAPPGCPFCGCDRIDKLTGNCAMCVMSRDVAMAKKIARDKEKERIKS